MRFEHTVYIAHLNEYAKNDAFGPMMMQRIQKQCRAAIKRHRANAFVCMYNCI